MSCFTDIKLTGVLFRIFQSNLYGTAHIGYTVAADDDKVSVTAPSFGIPRKFDGNDLGVGSCLLYTSSFSEVLQEMLFNQIVCYENLGDWENAKTKIAEYIQVYPDDADAQREAKFLETR